MNDKNWEKQGSINEITSEKPNSLLSMPFFEGNCAQANPG
jgi:hypothetical protein